jgi:8-oxo-dGTP pyrophosphatase MutT (NUDIX family)
MSEDKRLDGDVECISLYGGTKVVPRSKLKFRPGAYAVIARASRILLVRMRLNGKFCLPGGGIDVGEPALEALKREVREEAGIEIAVGEFLCMKENFHYFDPQDRAWHGFAFVWECDALVDGFDLDPDAGDEEEGNPEWVHLDALSPADCHGITWELVQEYRRKRGHDWAAGGR